MIRKPKGGVNYEKRACSALKKGVESKKGR